MPDCNGLPTACDLRTLLTVERVSATPDGRGGRTRVWSTHETVWASVAEGGGGEGTYAGGRRSTADYAATIRYTDITAKDRVIYEGGVYNIAFVVDIKMRRQWLKIGLKLGEPS